MEGSEVPSKGFLQGSKGILSGFGGFSEGFLLRVRGLGFRSSFKGMRSALLLGLYGLKVGGFGLQALELRVEGSTRVLKGLVSGSRGTCYVFFFISGFLYGCGRALFILACAMKVDEGFAPASINPKPLTRGFCRVLPYEVSAGPGFQVGGF